MRTLSLVLLGLWLTGCSVPVIRQIDERHQAGRLVTQAEAMAGAGNYPAAQEAYRRAIDEYAKSGAADRALFGLARLYTALENPNRDYRQAHEHFDRLLREYPQSRWVSDARSWRDVLATVLAQRAEMVALRRESERLRQEAQRVRQDLERLKELEIELERQRRR